MNKVNRNFLKNPADPKVLFLDCKMNDNITFLENFQCLDTVCKEKSLKSIKKGEIFPVKSGKISRIFIHFFLIFFLNFFLGGILVLDTQLIHTDLKILEKIHSLIVEVNKVILLFLRKK